MHRVLLFCGVHPFLGSGSCLCRLVRMDWCIPRNFVSCLLSIILLSIKLCKLTIQLYLEVINTLSSSLPSYVNTSFCYPWS